MDPFSLPFFSFHPYSLFFPPLLRLPLPPPPPPRPLPLLSQPPKAPRKSQPAATTAAAPAGRVGVRLRLGLWHEYTPLISALSRDGFTPASIEDATGIPGAEQNRLIVAAQVRDSLIASSAFTPDLFAFFDAGGSAELLYELRLLSASQLAATAARVAELCLDPRGARDLARSVKDFPRRRADDGWPAFSPDSPADCLAFALFRQSREALDPADRLALLRRALDSADTDSAKNRIADDVSPDFYAWVFLKCDHVAVGTGTVIAAAKPAIRRLQAAARARTAPKLAGGVVFRVEAHPIPEHPRPRRVAGRADGIILTTIRRWTPSTPRICARSTPYPPISQSFYFQGLLEYRS